MTNLLIRIVSQSATMPATVLGTGRKTKTLPRSKFTRNKLRERIQEQELDAEIAEHLACMYSDEQEPEDDFDGRDDDPSIEDRWDERSSGLRFNGWDRWRSAIGAMECDSARDDLEAELEDFGDDEPCDFEDDDFDFDPCYDDHPRYYNSELASVSETESASAYGSSEAGISLADVLFGALGLRAAMLVDVRREFDPDFGINSWWDYVPYCDPHSLLGPIYDRPRFSTERFVRLPGRKERFKKNKEQRGGNRRAYVDRWSKRWVDGVMVSDKNADGSRRIVKGKRSAECVEYSDFFRDKRNDWSYRDMTEALLEATDQDMAWDGKKKRNRRGGRGSKPRHSAASMYKVTLVDASRARKRLGDLGFQVEDLNAHVRSVLLKKKV